MPTSYEIYQTYLRGPAAIIRLFEQALGTQAIYGPPDPDMQQRTIESLSEDIGRLKHQIARLQEELRETRSDNHRLRRRNAELEAVITNDHASWCSFEKFIFAVRSAFSAANLVSVSGSSGNRYIFVPGSLPTAILPR